MTAEIEKMKRDNEVMRTALNFVIEGYDGHVSHLEYRVRVYQVALHALSALENDPGRPVPHHGSGP